MTVAVLMGVAGSGKSTVGALLAARLGWPFQEGDLLHPPANIAKMADGRPLTDDDRAPWLARVREWIAGHEDGVVSCSALKRSYRDVLRDERVTFVHLTATREQLLARLTTRQGHFMPAALLDSQLADLEPPGPDERAVTVDASLPTETQLRRIVAALDITT
ncbi:MAG: gluconokinase [Pseudonocardiales bacterium]|nr:gluconokinase [Pseudonocardiales bacterium]